MIIETVPVEIALGGTSTVAFFQSERIAAPAPAVLWRTLGERAGNRLLHLLPEGARPLASIPALDIKGWVGAIGRVRYRDGKLSPRIARSDALHFLDLPAGALLVDGKALAAGADRIVRPWDEYWTRDLACALARDGRLAGTNDLLADVPGAAPKSLRLPIRRASLATTGDPAGPLILVYGRLGASTSLYFDGLPADIAAQLRFLEPGDLFSDLTWLAAASLVIITRGFEHTLATGVVDLLEEIGTPMLWFTDDDFVALAGEEPSLGYYRADAVRNFARRMSGIGVTSAGLAHAMSGFHTNILLFPCVLDTDLWRVRPRAPAEPLGGGVIGGAFRRRSFLNHVLPAARHIGLGLVAGGDLARGRSQAQILPFQFDFRRFVLDWQAIAPAILLHPYGDTANIASKGPGSLLAAAYLGAIPIVGDESAYAELGEDQGVLKATADPTSWREQMRRALDEQSRRELAARFERWIATSFDPEHARPVFTALAARACSGGEHAAEQRLMAALTSRTLQRALPRQPAWRRRLTRLRRSLERRLANPRRG